MFATAIWIWKENIVNIDFTEQFTGQIDDQNLDVLSKI